MGLQSTSGVHRLRGKNILVVDDDADAAELFAMWLRRDGHQLSIAGDFARAAILAPMLRLDIALIDIGLPVIEGIELVGFLRSLPELVQCVFIAITAFHEPGLRATCLSAGFSEFFEKPVTCSALVDFIGSAPDARSNARSG